MGRRKFRPTTRRNYGNKKYQKRITVAVDTVCDLTDLVIHVPINLYLRNLTILMANVLARGCLFPSIQVALQHIVLLFVPLQKEY